MIKDQKLKLFFLIKKSFPPFKQHSHHLIQNKSSSETNKSTPSSILIKSSKHNNNLYQLLIHNLSTKYNATPYTYSEILLENFIQSKYCHYIACFKEKILYHYNEEFFKRFYCVNESIERIPRFVQYYKNYLLFFCRPIFSELKLNEVIQRYGEKQAQLFYNENYKEDEINNDDNDNNNNNNAIISDVVSHFEVFTNTVRHSISMVVGNSNNYNNDSVNDIKNQTLCFDRNTHNEILYSKYKDDISLVQSNTIKKIVFDLEKKRVDNKNCNRINNITHSNNKNNKHNMHSKTKTVNNKNVHCLKNKQNKIKLIKTDIQSLLNSKTINTNNINSSNNTFNINTYRHIPCKTSPLTERDNKLHIINKNDNSVQQYRSRNINNVIINKKQNNILYLTSKYNNYNNTKNTFSTQIQQRFIKSHYKTKTSKSQTQHINQTVTTIHHSKRGGKNNNKEHIKTIKLNSHLHQKKATTSRNNNNNNQMHLITGYGKAITSRKDNNKHVVVNTSIKLMEHFNTIESYRNNKKRMKSNIVKDNNNNYKRNNNENVLYKMFNTFSKHQTVIDNISISTYNNKNNNSVQKYNNGYNNLKKLKKNNKLITKENIIIK